MFFHVENQFYIDPDPDPDASCIGRCRMDIENIANVVNGRIILDETPQREKFSITGVGGSPLYAFGHVKNADHQEIYHGTHFFSVDTEQMRRHRITKSIIDSLEIRINGKKAATLGNCFGVSSMIVECNDGRHYYK